MTHSNLYNDSEISTSLIGFIMLRKISLEAIKNSFETEVFINFISDNKLININDNIVLGISGGSDSVFLFYLLLSIKKDFNLSIINAHVNYSLRGSDSDDDEEFVRNLSKKYDIECYLLKKTIDKHENIQSTARNIRMSFLLDIAKRNNSKIAFAHHKNDQIETFLMRLIKGGSLNALTGIKTSVSWKNTEVIHPILNFSKDHILEFLESNNIAFRTDLSNYQNKYVRNQIRNIIFPKLLDINPFFPERIENVIDLLNATNKYIEKEAENALKNISLKDRCINEEIAVDIKKLKKLDDVLINHIIAKIIMTLLDKYRFLTIDSIQIISEFIKNDTINGTIFQNKLLNIRIEKGVLAFYKLLSKEIKSNIYKLKIGENHFGNWIITINLLENQNLSVKDIREKSKYGIMYLPKKVLDGEFVVRYKKNGDKINLFSKKSSTKLKKILSDAKIPYPKRQSVLIFEYCDKVISYFSPHPHLLIRNAYDYNIDLNESSFVCLEITPSLSLMEQNTNLQSLVS